MARSLDDWRRLVTGSYPEGLVRAGILATVQALFDKGMPALFTVTHIADEVQIDPIVIRQMLNAPGKFYRSFQIPKRRGGFRQIEVPYPSLMTVQRWIHKEILLKCETHPAVNGFVIGRSILTNALNHCGKESILRIDIRDFFPSIRLPRVISVFQHIGYLPRTSYYLALLCTNEKCLPQGAPTSPLISNIVCGMLDRRLTGLAAKHSLTYTRYADDLVFSGAAIPEGLADLVRLVLLDEGFEENKQKTFLATGHSKKVVTGLSVSGDKPKVQRTQRRKWRQEYYFVRKFGAIDHGFRTGNSDPLYLESLLGKFNFWRFIEPENEFVAEALVQLKKIQQEMDSIELPVPT